LFVLRFYGLQPKTFGHIIEKATGSPLPFAILRVFISGSEIEIASKPADQYGKYYCLVPPGKYYVEIDKKEADGSYKNVLKSGIINASKKGLIKERFLI